MTSEKFLHRSLAVVTISLSAIALAGCSLLGAGTDKTDEDADDVFSIEVGDCLNDADVDGEVSEVPIVECTVEHDSEAYAKGNLADGDFPDDDTLTAGAEAICGPAFNTFIGLGYEESAYDYNYYVPTAESWANGDREVMCIAYADDASRLTGSLKGINA